MFNQKQYLQMILLTFKMFSVMKIKKNSKLLEQYIKTILAFYLFNNVFFLYLKENILFFISKFKFSINNCILLYIYIYLYIQKYIYIFIYLFVNIYILKQYIKYQKKQNNNGQVLWKSAEDSPYQWYHVTVLEYNVDQDTFTIEFENGETAQTQRIYLCFDIEDPKKFIKRISVAFQKRLYADSIIRYKFYI